MSVAIEKKHIKHRKIIGKSEAGDELELLTTYGGLQIIMRSNGAKSEIVGAGAHSAVAKFESEKKMSKTKITWNDED